MHAEEEITSAGPPRRPASPEIRRLGVGATVATLAVPAVLAGPVLRAALAAPAVPAASTASAPRSITGPVPICTPARVPPDSTARRLASRLPELMESAEIPGLSVALVCDGEVVWTGAFGVRSAESGAPVDEGTVFQAASLSKPVFAFAVMQLVEQGLLDLDTPLAEYLPYSRLEHEPRYRRITARMVLSHSTGLPNWGGDRLELRFDPGTGFGYSGEGYVYLQAVVEELTGLALDDLVRRAVFEPLGMDRSAYVWEPRFEGNVAVGHDALNQPVGLRRPDEANAAASLLTTARDYGRFVAALLSGAGMAPETRRTMLEPELRAEVPFASEEEIEHIEWALGWGVQEAEERSFWHWGDNGSFKAFVAAFPAQGTAVVYFANSTHGLAIAEEVARLVSGARHWGPGWAGYEQHDDPSRRARRELLHTFRTSGVEAGLQRLAAIRERSPALFDLDLGTDLASLLQTADLDAAAVGVLEVVVDAFPDSASAREELAETYLETRRFESARQTLAGLAESAEREAAERYRYRLDWVERRIRAERDPVNVPIERLRAYAGDYGPRHVSLEDGTLYYQRDGNPRYRLLPLGREVFQPLGIETFRLRFVTDGEGKVTKVIGRYFDGREDENARDGG